MKKVLLSVLGLVLNQLLGKVELPALKGWIENTVEKLKTVVVILTDDVPDNKAQLQMFWKAIQNDFTNESLETAINIVKQKVHDVHSQEIIVELIQLAIKENNKTIGTMKTA
jgi:hypothetical protein